jgi:hypothetical protein
MSKFLDRIERIREGAPAPLGFSLGPREKVAGMALVTMVSGDHQKGMGVVAEVGPDAAIVAGADGAEGLKSLAESLSGVPWGARVSSLSEDEAQAYKQSGSDLLAFPLENTTASALDSEEMARILSIDSEMGERQFRAVASLPVDAFLVSMTQVSGPWTLKDLATLGSISRRVDKYVLVEVAQPPGKKDLEALRDMGVQGLVLDVGAVSPESLSELKQALLDMPRPKFNRRERPRVMLPGSVYGLDEGPEPEHEHEEEEEEE